MSALPRQTAIAPGSYFFLRADVSTITANNIVASNISTLSADVGALNAGSGVFNTISTQSMQVGSIDGAGKIETNEFSSIFSYANEGTISTLFTQHIILDQATIDVANGNTILLNGIPLATTQDLSTIQDWAIFPAVSTIYMLGNDINGAGNITCQNIYNALNIQTDTLSALTSVTAPAGTITNLRTTNLSTIGVLTAPVIQSPAGLQILSPVSTNQLSVGTESVGVLNASSITSGSGAFNSLSSLAISTGALSVAGQPFISGSNWAFYPAGTNVNMNGFDIVSGSQPSFTITASNNLTESAGVSYCNVVDRGIDVGGSALINLNAKNGFQGAINIQADPGFAGVFGRVDITANGGTTGGVGTGGLVNITANTPLGFSNLTSAVKINAAGVNIYSGAIPPIGSLAGYSFIHSDVGTNITTGLPPTLPNIPGTTYLYGTNGVTTSSDFYTPTIQPYWNGLTNPPDLLVSGRYILANLYQVCLNLSNVKQLNFQSNVATYMSNCDNISMSANGTISTSNLTSINGTITTLSNTTLVGAGGTISGYATINAGAVNATTLLGSNLVSTTALNLSSINGFASFGTKSIRVQGDVAQIQLSNNNPAGSGTILNLLSRVGSSEIQSFNSNFTTPLPLTFKGSYLSTGNDFYLGSTITTANQQITAGVRQPFIQYGTLATSGGSGSGQVEVPVFYADSNYTCQVSMRDVNPAQLSVDVESLSSFTIYWANGGGGSHNINWTTFGDL